MSVCEREFNVHESLCVCVTERGLESVYERERERECVYERKKECVRERFCVCDIVSVYA